MKNHENFSIHFIKDKKIIFDADIINGDIVLLDKYISEDSRYIVYEKQNGYAPKDHEIANQLISKLTSIAKSSYKN